MRTFLLFAALIVVGAGCKRGTKSTGTAREVVSPKVTPSPSAPPTERKGTPDKKDEPNWLKDERIPPKKDQLPADGSPSDGKTPWGVGAPAGGFQQPAPGAQPNPAGAPAVQPPAPAAAPPATTPARPAARVSEADMKDVWVFIENASGASGKMPPVANTYAALVAAGSPAAALVKDGAIILTSPTARESVWAYEARAYLSGGLVVTNGGVEKMTAAELKQRLGK